MASSRQQDDLLKEAAEWFTRLNARTVSVSDLEAFRHWRADPQNRSAYETIEKNWRRAGDLRGDPDIAAALGSIPTREQRRQRRAARKAWIGMGLAACIGLVVVGSWVMARPTTYSTAVGERRVVRLADGSELQLDTNSQVAVRYDGDSRNLTLVRGQALFNVAHDAARPFEVRIDGTVVTATGTRFDVRRDDGRVRVTLIEGGVTVVQRASAETKLWRLEPGQQIATDDRSIQASGDPVIVDLEAVTSWTEGRLVFEAVPLRAAVAEINRYGRDRIVLPAELDGTLPISGAFDAGDSPAFAEAVARLYGLRVRPQGDRILLVSPSPENKS